MSTENIVKFLQTAYSDEKLAALLAHAQDGKLAYRSCCCLVGLASAGHSFKQIDEYSTEEHFNHPLAYAHPHSDESWAVSDDFCALGADDYDRRAVLIPLILAEMERREKLAISILPSRKPLVRIPEDSDQGDEQPEWDDTDTSREFYSGIQRGCQ